MAFPLHINAERIGQEFDSRAFEAGQAIAPDLVGCVTLARLSGVDSMKPFWLRSSPVPSEFDTNTSHTSASSFYSDVKGIATPWRPSIILHTVMNPWHVGIEMTIAPVTQSSDNYVLDSAAWAPINLGDSPTGSFGAVEISPRWPRENCFVGVGHLFKVRCQVKKAHIVSMYRVSPPEVDRLRRWEESAVFESDFSGPPYPFPYRIHPYCELASYPMEESNIDCVSWDNYDAWNTENVQIAAFLKRILDAGLEPSSLTDHLSHHGLPVYSSWSDKATFYLVSILITPAFDGLLSHDDCSALTLIHPALTRPAQRLMLRHLSVKTDLQVRNVFDALRVHHDLLPLVDTLHLDTRISDEVSSPTCRALVDLVSPWLVEIAIVSDGSAQVASYLDSVAFAPGLRSITLRSMQSLHAAPGGILWPLYWMKHGGFDNLKHFVLVGVDLYFDSGTEWISSLESFELEHCCLRFVGESGDDGIKVSLLHVLSGSVTTIRSLKLVSVAGISPESVKDTIQACYASLEHLHLSEVCQRANPPVSLRTALSGKSLVTFVVENSGFVDFAGFRCEQKSNRQVWYGEGGEDWDLLGGRTHFDHWSMTMRLHYHDGDSYTPFVSDDGY
ncbi:hypothetical protein PILCRDRAFT_8481 [Piloderma croceum F 1598]|uniref:Uncharacterized protein n=1 Tax=Piloderma croceum (strain F 1598) TaxID=765440 RepID=A0A0C3FQ21_PILCF|nr:hypothetical protein PILCRDRAFT_8481 [Piloderma croceum F 1598]